MHELVDMRDFVSEDRKAEYKLYPYAKDLNYTADGLLTMTVEMYNDTTTEYLNFSFSASPQMRRFLDRSIGDEDEE